MITGVISPAVFIDRINFWSDKRINRLNELMAYEKSLGIPATYFFVMRPGLGVGYTWEQAKPFMNDMLANGFEIGVHGMAYNDEAAMREELERFISATGIQKPGVRMHYLRNDSSTIKNLAQTGYWFDSTEYKVAAPYFVGDMVEFPIGIMDAYAVRPTHKTMDIAKSYSLERLEIAERQQIPFFTINFHDLVFNPAYVLYKDWFTWFIDLCQSRGYEFTSFSKAIKEEYANKKIQS
jgi:peptidoglycan/xylan/chitin deacetylase (PgdA/CDA1 family)